MRTDIDVEKGVQWLHSAHTNYPTTPHGAVSSDGKGKQKAPPSIDTSADQEVR